MELADVLPRSKRGWIYQILLWLIIGLVARQYFTASAQARLLEDQLEVALDSVAVVIDSLTVEREVSDSLIALTEEHIREDSIAIAEVRDSVISAVATTDQTVGMLRRQVQGIPQLEETIALLTQQIEEEREAWAQERATSAAALFASQQRERALGQQLLDEREASDQVIAGLQVSLALAIEEGEAWERAANPGALTQIWRQGRAAAVAVALVLALK